MPLPIPAIAIPVLHSSRGWIASTAASGYIAGTLSGTWVGAFVLGNSGLLSSLGLVSAAGIFGASGGFAGLSSSAALGVGSALSAIGLGGVASSLGIAPPATFLGLTAVSWATAGGAVALLAALGYYLTRKTMRKINEERHKGGLEPITVSGIRQEVLNLELQSLRALLVRLAKEGRDILLSPAGDKATIDGLVYPLRRLRYLINKDKTEEIVFIAKLGRKKRVLLVT